MGARSGGKRSIELGEHSVFAGHVVRPGSDRAQRRSTQNQIDGGIAEKVGQVGVTTGELSYGRFADGALHSAIEICRQGRDPKTFVGPDLDYVAALAFHAVLA